MKTSFRHLLKRFVYAWGLAYIVLLPAFYNTVNVDTRFAMRWNATDFYGILMGVGAMALLIWVLVGLADGVFRCGSTDERTRAVLWWMCGIMACYLCLRSIRMILESSGSTVWLESVLSIRPIRYGLYVGMPLLIGVILRGRFKVLVQRLCAFGAILGGIYFVTAVTYFQFALPGHDTSLPENTAASDRFGGSMFLFIFDECAYTRIYPHDVLREDMPHFRAFSNRATSYRRCYSEGTETPLSIPRLLLKDDSSLRTGDDRRLMLDISAGKMQGGASIFTDATNFLRVVSGLHVDYDRLVGNDVEYVLTYVFRSRLPLPEKALRIWLVAFPVLGRVVHRPILAETGMFIESVLDSEKLMLELAQRTAKEPVFAVCHVALPHYPFVWDAQGLVEERACWPIDKLTKGVAGYEGNLRYMDAVFGRFLDQLRQAGRFDDSLLIVTSDHAWREDPDLPPYDICTANADLFNAYKHVPLWIKAPGQRVGQVVDNPIHLRALQLLLARWLAGEQGLLILE